MALIRARVIPREELRGALVPFETEKTVESAVIVPRERVEALAEAHEILRAAREEARALVEEARRTAEGARQSAVREGRDEGAASLAAALLRLRAEEQRSLSQREDDVMSIARALAERLLGRALELSPSLVVDLARQSLRSAARARRIHLFVHPDDADALTRGLGDLGVTAPHLEVHIDPALARGSLRAETDLGVLDAGLPLQLDRLVAALRR